MYYISVKNILYTTFVLCTPVNPFALLLVSLFKKACCQHLATIDVISE